MKTKTEDSVLWSFRPGYNVYENVDSNGNWYLSGRNDWTATTGYGQKAVISYDDTIRHGTLKTTRLCTHTKCVINGASYVTTCYTDAAHTRRQTQANGGWGDVTPLTVPSGLAPLHAEALAFFESGCVEREFDLGLNLLEWKSTVALFKGLMPTLKTLRYFLSSKDKSWFLNQGLLLLNKKISEVTLKDLANAHLSYEFGIKPLLSDIEGCVAALSVIREKLAWLRKNQGKPVKVRFVKDLSTVYKPAEVSEPPGNSWERYYITTRGYSCKYHAYALMVYDTQKLNDAELALRVFARQAGVDSVLRNLWEFTPWSFAVDWILDVGTWIESFDPRVTLPYRMLDLGWSISIVESREKYKTYTYPKNTSFDVLGSTWKSLYYREPGLPISFSSIATGSPGARQLALSFSLAVQKMHR